MNVIIVDDEPLALDVLETYIERMPNLNLIARCNNAFEANEALKNNEIDLMFLDIQMPQLTGIELLKTLVKPPMVIFTTAYQQYAIEGFELNALDYLLKPISMDRFMKSVNKANEQYNLHHKEAAPAPQKAADTEGVVAQADAPDYIFVKADKKLIRVKFSDILYIEGLKDYVIIRLETGRVISLQTMKSLEDKLPSAQFVRVHRSYIVGMDKIQAIVGNMVEVMEKGQPKHLPIGKNYRDELLEMIDQHKL
ncbi:MAG: LytTR family DNA-binding domain-containing protein [Saprospiraceae bacterium]|nr:LytTR family DNA-binding domain-containing protein [Saprospiraceae bacterium]